MVKMGGIEFPDYNPLSDIQRKIVEDNERRNRIAESISKRNLIKEQKESDHYNQTDEMAQEIKELKGEINSIIHTLNLMYMAMGQHGQRATREHIEIKELMEEYFNILKSDEGRTSKDSKLLGFFSNLPNEIALKIIIDGGFAILKYAFA